MMKLWLKTMVAAALAALVFHSNASGAEVVHFNSAILPATAKNESGITQKEGFPIWGHLGKPAGKGAFPAVVLMHGCGGLQQAHFDWASEFNEQGYVTLIMDSFRPRSVMRVCTFDTRPTSPAQRALDAYGALAFLRGMPDVDPARIGVIGWSHGGISALEAVNMRGISQRFEHKFRVAAAFYPYCIADREFDLPTLILIGEADDWTPPELCLQLAERNQSFDQFELVTYPGAFHGFDNIDFEEGFSVQGAGGSRHWLQHDPASHRDTADRIKTFLDENLSVR
ncbi:MAG: dienelactone hydrolase family protein [Hyphomicrobiales bacterium]|nr:dienelactone hydrolase family protein [Hyphomicrobiales bacterium]MCP4998708.1 dienelactone hydrolase family protein [Hyphomicrobiales bacterium]